MVLRRAKAAALLFGLLALGACDTRPKTAKWDQVCVASHTEVMYLPQYIPNGNGGGVTIIQPRYRDVCDAYEWRCIAGKDGTTKCLGSHQDREHKK